MNRIDDGEAGDAGQSADEVVEVDVHLRERHLDALDMRAAERKSMSG